MRRFIWLLVLLAVGCSAATSATGAPPCSPPPSTVRFHPGAELSVDIADTDALRERGLMGVTDLPRNQGMAFVWDAPTDVTFWMKDTLIPLSIAFADENGHVITVREMTPCEADPCPTYAADGPYTVAVEANEGWFGDHGVEPGERMELIRGACL